MLSKTALISASIIVVLSLFVYGCSRHPYFRFMKASPEKRAEFIVNKISDELDLTDTQKNKLNLIKEEVIAKHKSRKGKYEEGFNFLQSEIKKDKLDENLLKQKLDAFHADREEMQSFMISKFVEFHSILTKEQKETLVAKMTEMKEKFHVFN